MVKSSNLNTIKYFWLKFKKLLHKLYFKLKIMGGGIEAHKNTLIKVIYAIMAIINGWEEWDLPAKLIASMPRRLAAVRLVKGKQTKYWMLFSMSRAFIWAINHQY